MDLTMTFKNRVFSMINVKILNDDEDRFSYEGTLCIDSQPFVDCYDDGTTNLTNLKVIDNNLYLEALNVIDGETYYYEEIDVSLNMNIYCVAYQLAYNYYLNNK